MEPSVSAVDHPVQIRALPPDRSVEPCAESSSVLPDITEPDALEPAGLDQDRDVPRDIGSRAQVGLTKSAS
jgi:hypothetical protein